MTTSADTESRRRQDERIGLWAQIREDWRTNGRDWTLPGFRAIAVYRFGVWRMSIKRRWMRIPFSILYKMLYRFVRNHYNIELPYTAKIGRRLFIAHQGTVVFHENAQVGDDCLIRHGVTLGAASHRRAHDAPRLGNGVQVGAGAMILGDITLGDGATVGANAVVISDVPAYARVIAAASRILESRPHAPSDGDDDETAERGDAGVAERMGGAPTPLILLMLGFWQGPAGQGITHAASACPSLC